jgi:hypothetical protein
MTNAMISLALTLAVGATLGSQIATAANRETAVRATQVAQPLPAHVARQLTIIGRDPAS